MKKQSNIGLIIEDMYTVRESIAGHAIDTGKGLPAADKKIAAITAAMRLLIPILTPKERALWGDNINSK